MNNATNLKDPPLTEEELVLPMYKEVKSWLLTTAKLEKTDDNDLIEICAVDNKRKVNEYDGIMTTKNRKCAWIGKTMIVT